jgi:hypothetical protein
VNSSGKFFRLGLEFKDTEPQLDDVNSIPALLSTRLDDSQISVIDEILQCALMSRFYLELEERLERTGAEYRGNGRLLCKLDPNEVAYEELMTSVQG